MDATTAAVVTVVAVLVVHLAFAAGWFMGFAAHRRLVRKVEDVDRLRAIARRHEAHS